MTNPYHAPARGPQNPAGRPDHHPTPLEALKAPIAAEALPFRLGRRSDRRSPPRGWECSIVHSCHQADTNGQLKISNYVDTNVASAAANTLDPAKGSPRAAAIVANGARMNVNAPVCSGTFNADCESGSKVGTSWHVWPTLHI